MRIFPRNLTAKVVALVIFMGTASALITVYATWHMRNMERQYHHLFQQQALAATTLGNIRHHLGHASGLVHAVLTAQDEESMLVTQAQLTHLQADFERNLAILYPMLPGHELELDTVWIQARQAFYAGHRVIASTLRWRGDRALQVLTANFQPADEKLNADMLVLRNQAKQVFTHISDAMTQSTRRTMITSTLAGWLSVLIISGLAAWFALRHISQPVARLTLRMQRMASKDFSSPIPGQHRPDELGSMARTLQSFATSMQEREALEKALVQQQRDQLLTTQLLDMTSALPGAVFQLRCAPGQPLHLQFISPQWVSIMGVSEDAARSTKSIGQLIARWDAQAASVAEQHFRHSAQTLEPVDFEVSLKMMDGITRWIKTRANPRQEADGSVTFHGVWMDVSKQVVQSLALEKAKRHAEQIAHEKSVLQASISHEIRTPLNAILGLTQLVLKADLPPPQRAHLQDVLRASQHLRGIVNEVLDFSKIDAGQLQLESTDFHLQDVLRDVMSMCAEDAASKGLQLRHRMGDAVPVQLRGDPHRIAQILLNYVNNAIKFTEQGQVEIAITLAPDSTLHRIKLCFRVIDTGPGIPADRLPVVFQAFQQADNSITRRFGGTGLGLTISRALAQLMGGETGVDSQLGHGSSFWFTAVMEPARNLVEPSSIHAAHDVAADTGWHGLRILVVDDHPLNRTVAQGLLEATGFAVQTAEDGAQALSMLEAVGPEHFACVLMDVQMPTMDGITATRALRKLPGFAPLPVVAMTAHTGLQDIAQCLSAGMDAHLAKPLLDGNLQATLRQVLSHPAKAQPPIATAPLSDGLPTAVASKLPSFQSQAVDDLLAFFDADQVQELVRQFCADTTHRLVLLQSLAQCQDWSAMRGEAHKLSGTAATFGLVQLGVYSTQLSAALKLPDVSACQALVAQLVAQGDLDLAQLQAYCAALHR